MTASGERADTVLVTGAAGYLGSHAVVGLTRAGYRVVGVDNFENSDPGVVDAMAGLLGERPLVHRADVRDEHALACIVRNEHVTSAIHFAGVKSVGESMREPLRYHRTNVGTSVALLSVLRRSDVRRLVFSSSCTVYGNPPSVPVDETAPIAPISPYGRTKAAVEAILRDLVTSEPGWSVRSLRYFNPVGADESGRIGEDPSVGPTSLLPSVMAAAAGEAPLVRVFGGDHPTPDGTCVRDYIHVSDLIDAHVLALDDLTAVDGFDALDVATGRGVSVLEMLAVCSAAVGLDIPHRVVDRRPGDASEVWASGAAAHERLRWGPTRTLQDMAADHWRWQRDHPHGYHRSG